MKRVGIIVIVFFFTSTLLSVVYAGSGQSAKYNGKPPGDSVPQSTLGVDQFMGTVDRYKGTVTIQGVVSGIFPKHQMVTLIDTNEYKACAVTTCARLTLPVKWTGLMPQIKDTVSIEGQVQKARGKLVFVAKHVTKVGPGK